jgi:hypothetical protein
MRTAAGIEAMSRLDAILPAGLDYSNCFFHDPHTKVPVCMDNGTSHNCKKINGHRKIVSYRYLAHTFSGYAADVTFGHGTHVAGTIAGNVMSSVASEEEYARKYNGCVIDHTHAVYAERVPMTLPWWSVALCSAYSAWCVNAIGQKTMLFTFAKVEDGQRDKETKSRP